MGPLSQRVHREGGSSCRCGHCTAPTSILSRSSVPHIECLPPAGGGIPASLGACTRLKLLALNENQLEGGVPTALSECSDLELLLLNNNKALVGELPGALQAHFKDPTAPVSRSLIAHETQLTVDGGRPVHGDQQWNIAHDYFVDEL